MGLSQQESGVNGRNPINKNNILPFSCFFCLEFLINLVLINANIVSNEIFIPIPPFQKEKSCIR